MLERGRRRTDKELWVPITADAALFEHGRGHRNLDKGDERSSSRDGSRGVHDNADRTMIGVAAHRVGMSNLRKGKQGEQDQAQKRDGRGHS